MSKIRISLLLLLVIFSGEVARAACPSLVRIERKTQDDRALLIHEGVPLVAEFSYCFLAYGDLDILSETAAKLDYRMQVMDDSPEGSSYFILGLRPGWSEELLDACGVQLWQEENWVLVKSPLEKNPACFDSPSFRAGRLTLEKLQPPTGPPAEYARFASGESMLLQTKPLVQEMVDAMTSAVVLQNWNDIVDSATTRNSRTPGCQAAADAVSSKFQGLCLNPKPQEYDSTFAPNIVGKIEGKIHPENVYIAIGHLDDMPSAGAAPGADDNASGSAMVTALGEIMSRYAFENSAVFLVVTGEEQGLIGSGYYAADAGTRGEKIEGVLDADMIAWEGDGTPAPENLDLNYNGTSQWLGELFAQLSSDYATGCVVDAFPCPSSRYSDHVPFWDNGWAAVEGITDNEGDCGHGGNYPYYHTSNDTIANCGDTTFFVGAVRAYLAVLAHLANPLCKNPDPPTGLAVSAQGANSILVAWTPAAGKVVYEIYRAAGGCSTAFPYTKVGESVSPTFLDTTASGTLNYAYRVQSRDKTGYCISCPAPCAEASTTGGCYEAPLFSGLASVADDNSPQCSLTLAWPDVTQNFCGTAAIFNVYRSTDPDFLPEPQNRIASCVGVNYYTDADVDPGVIYFYVVRAEDNTTGHAGPCGGNEEKNLVKVSGTATGPRTILFSDDFENGLGQWNAGNTWTASSNEAHGGIQSAWGGNQGQTCSDLTLANPLALPAGSPVFLEYWVSYNLEATYDGVQMQFSTDNGNTWNLLTPVGGYPSTVRANCTDKLGSDGYSGDSVTWVLQRADLSGYAGQSVEIRFVMMSDRFVDSGGFYLDDVSVYATTVCGTNLVIRSPVVHDSCPDPSPGNADGILDPNEDVTLEVTAGNLGGITATGVTAVLTTSTPGVAITGDTAGFPDIAAGASENSMPPHFAFHVPSSAPCGSAIELNVHFASSEGSWDDTVTLGVGSGTPAPGEALNENFDASGIPAGWTVVDGFNDGKTWFADNSADPQGCGNLDPIAPISGNWAAADSDCAGSVPMDEQLITPSLDLRATTSATLEFDHYFNRYSTEFADLDIRSSGTGGAWVTVGQWRDRTPGPLHEAMDITAKAAGAHGVQIRWRYYNADFGLYWYIDNVIVRYSSINNCVMNPCPHLPDEVSPPGSVYPLLLVKDRAAATCPTGYCMYFEKEPVATGYNIYEGTLGAWYSHGGAPGDACNPAVADLADGYIRYSASPTAGDHYYIVTAFNGKGEGTAGSAPEDAQLSCPP